MIAEYPNLAVFELCLLIDGVELDRREFEFMQAFFEASKRSLIRCPNCNSSNSIFEEIGNFISDDYLEEKLAMYICGDCNYEYEEDPN